MESYAKKYGLRLIAVDRPGFGQSTFQPYRRVNDFPNDIASLADHLDLNQFSLFGISGGGPYALACAAELNSRVDKLLLVCAMGSIDIPDATKGMHFPLFPAIEIARTMPRHSYRFYKNMVGPVLAWSPKFIVSLYGNLLSAAERAVFADSEFMGVILGAMREGFRQGGAGAAREMNIFTHSWQVDLKKIRAKTWLWHGEEDSVVPLSHSQHHAEQIKNAQTYFLPNEGHFSLPYRHIDTITCQIAS